MFPLWTKVVFPICALASVVLSFKNPIIPGFVRFFFFFHLEVFLKVFSM